MVKKNLSEEIKPEETPWPESYCVEPPKLLLARKIAAYRFSVWLEKTRKKWDGLKKSVNDEGG